MSQSTSAVTLLSDGELDTLALGQGDPGLLLANDENVALTGGKGVVNGVLDVDNVEASVVTLTVGDDTNTAHVTTTSDHGDGASVELDEVGDLAGGEVNLDGVVDLDQGVRVTDAVKEEELALARGQGGTYSRQIKLPSSSSLLLLPLFPLCEKRESGEKKKTNQGRGEFLKFSPSFFPESTKA